MPDRRWKGWSRASAGSSSPPKSNGWATLVRQPGRVADVAVRLVDPVRCLCVGDRPAVEGRVEQRVPHRLGERLATRFEAAQVRDEVAVVGVRSLQREGGRREGVLGVVTEWRVQLLVGLLEVADLAG